MSKSFDPRNIATERPSVLDELGHRLFLHPAEVSGFFRRARTWVYSFLIALFLVVPWTTFDGQQTIFLNITARKFVFFGNTFWAHDTPLIFLPLIIAVFTIVFITSLFGRAWCGWACPQTVFIDGIFRKIETWIEGNHIQRAKLDKAPWNKQKISRRIAKWFLFLIVSEHIAHSFFAYFVGAHNLFWITMGSPLESWSLFLAVQVFAAVLLFDFGWFREQFCIIMCPYGRFQSVLMGPHSMAVLYDEKRGEPRGYAKKGSQDKFGDCIDCYKCVSCCPTGIDIRNGLQMECIACTACMDACDDVMKKLGRKPGLIRYSTEAQMNSGSQRRKVSPASYVYGALLILLVGALTYLVSQRTDLDFQVLRGVGAPYEFIGSGETQKVSNHFRIHFNNQGSQEIRLTELSGPVGTEIVAPTLPFLISPGQDGWVHFFVKFPGSKAKQMVSEPQVFQAKFSQSSEGPQIQLFDLQLLAPL